MRPPQKGRGARNKGGRNKPVGNVINRVFESAGPEGKVRGTPQQIIEKYQNLARDAQTAGERVLSESYLQHAEHYVRLLSAAYEQAEERRREQQAQNGPDRGDGGQDGDGQHRGGQPSYAQEERRGEERSDERRGEARGQTADANRDAPSPAPASSGALDTIDVSDEADGPIDTPETKRSEPAASETPSEPVKQAEGEPAPKKPRARRRRKETPAAESETPADASGDASEPAQTAESG
jgi:hypothetical protein